jgi:hypothetical protein
MQKCANCELLTKNAKYCSRRCAITINNTKHPKREKVQKECKNCHKVTVLQGSLYCDACRKEHIRYGGKEIDYKSLTIQDILDRFDREKHHPSWKMSNLRYYTRKWNSHRPRKCEICDYDKHVEYAHIKPLAKLPTSTTLWEASSESNVAILCPNHHWEFDNGLINLPR